MSSPSLGKDRESSDAAISDKGDKGIGDDRDAKTTDAITDLGVMLQPDL